MQLMVKGDKWEMYIPSERGYGDRGSPPKIPGGSVLVFVMEILEINGATVPAARCDPKSLAGCSEKEKEYVDKQAAKDAPARAEDRVGVSRPVCFDDGSSTRVESSGLVRA